MKTYFVDDEFGRLHWVDITIQKTDWGDIYDYKMSAGLCGFNRKELIKNLSGKTICFDIGKSHLCKINLNDLLTFCKEKN